MDMTASVLKWLLTKDFLKVKSFLPMVITDKKFLYLYPDACDFPLYFLPLSCWGGGVREWLGGLLSAGQYQPITLLLYLFPTFGWAIGSENLLYVFSHLPLDILYLWPRSTIEKRSFCPKIIGILDFCLFNFLTSIKITLDIANHFPGHIISLL